MVSHMYRSLKRLGTDLLAMFFGAGSFCDGVVLRCGGRHK